MRIVVANINTTERVTEAIREQAQRIARPDTEILAVTPSFGPPSVEGNFESYLAAVAVMDRVTAIEEPFDAVVLAGFGEHGKEGLAELLAVPVVDITEAAAHLAGLLGRRYTVVTSLQRTTGQIHDRLRLAGVAEQCVSVRATSMPVLELDADLATTSARVAEEARHALTDDGAEVVCLGCAGMSGLADRVRDELGVPVIDGVTAAVGLAETLVRLGLTTSRAGGFARPRDKNIPGWPITR